MLDYNYNPLIPGQLYKVSYESEMYVDLDMYKLVIIKNDLQLLMSSGSIYYELTPTDILMYISCMPEIDYVNYEMHERGYRNPMIPMYLYKNSKTLIPLNNSDRTAIVSIRNDVLPVDSSPICR